MKKKRTIKFATLFSLVEAIFIVILITAIAFVSVGQFEDILKKSATTGAERTVKQVSFSTSDYISNLIRSMDVVKGELFKSEEDADMACKGVMKINSSLKTFIFYDEEENIKKIWHDGAIKDYNFKNNSNYCSFAVSDEYYFSKPHVQNMFENKYPWVLTAVIPVKGSVYGDGYLSADIDFSGISASIDKTGIGQHGYCYIVDGSGENIYHPHQQLFATGIKEKEKKIDLNSGVIYDDDKFYMVMPIEKINWKLVGVGFIGELTSDYSSTVVTTMVAICSVAIIIAIAVIILLTTKLTRPVGRLVKEIKKFEKDVSNYRFSLSKKNSIEEMDRLYGAFCRMVPMVQNLIEKVKNEQEELRKSQLKALQNQINPHFLYNTLDSILWMCEMKKTEEAAQMISALAKLFRISISKGKEIIILAKELESAESYLKIQSVRYNHKFTYKIDVDDEVMGCRCNKTVLQPFLENALSHGYIEGEDFEITISGKREGNNVVIAVKDNGMGIPEDKLEAVRQGKYATGSGIGIGNVDKRIKMSFGEEYGIRLESEEDRGTTVFIVFPFEKEKENEG